MKGTLKFRCATPRGNEYISPGEQMQSLSAIPHIVKEHGGQMTSAPKIVEDTDGFDLIVFIECNTEETARDIGFRCACYLGNMNFNRGTGSEYEWEPEKTSGCFVATAVYGGYDTPEVRVLREFRDNNLSVTNLGRLVIRTYYRCGPFLAMIVGRSKMVRIVAQLLLDRIVSKYVQDVKRKNVG